MLLAIDPGYTQSAYCVIDDDLRPIEFDLILNDSMLCVVNLHHAKDMVIEKVQGYGMVVGAEVFDTCMWTGRFYELGKRSGKRVHLMPRREVKLHTCGRASAKDSNIIAALQERFGGKGTKKEPGWFYGFKKDIWQAYALGVAFMEVNHVESGTDTKTRKSQSSI